MRLMLPVSCEVLLAQPWTASEQEQRFCTRGSLHQTYILKRSAPRQIDHMVRPLTFLSFGYHFKQNLLAEIKLAIDLILLNHKGQPALFAQTYLFRYLV